MYPHTGGFYLVFVRLGDTMANKDGCFKLVLTRILPWYGLGEQVHGMDWISLAESLLRGDDHWFPIYMMTLILDTISSNRSIGIMLM